MRELLLRLRDELGQLRGDSVEPVCRVEAGEDTLERGEKLGIGIAAAQVTGSRREVRNAADAHRRDCRDGRSAAPVGDDEAAVLERPVGGGNRRRADLDRRCELANRRQPRLRREPAVRDLGLDRGRDRCGAGSGPDSLY